jgi:hypothetical protein
LAVTDKKSARMHTMFGQGNFDYLKNTKELSDKIFETYAKLLKVR